jgi:hypothetical protein
MVAKKSMPLVAAIFYIIGGSQLIFFALSWLHLLTSKQIIIGLIIGIPIGIGKYFLVFHKLNKKNALRLSSGDEFQKLFSVFKGKTYIIILGMVFLGISLRIIFNVSRAILMPVYMAIGIALFMSSMFYFIRFFELRKAMN